MRARRPAISIITPTFNRRKALERAIRSVQRQSLDNYEHIVVDDCSTDDTPAFLGGLTDARLRIIRLPQWQGANPARNAGVELARAEWLTFLDSDDEFLPHRLAATLAAAERQRVGALLLSSFTTVKRGVSRPAINPAVNLTGPELEQALMAYGIVIAGSAITVRRRTLLRAGGFAPHLQRMQDREALLRLAAVTGAQLLSTVDWTKHPSADSISLPRPGYLPALAALLDAHPELAARYRGLVGYHLARHVLADLLRGRFRLAHQALRFNAQSRTLGFTGAELWRSYFGGAAARRALVRQLAQREDEPILLPFPTPERRAARAPLARAA